MLHAIGLDVERDVEFVGRHLEVELRVVVGRLAVHLRAQARDDVVETARRDLGRSAEHHVFERVREAGFAGRLVQRSKAIPDRGLNDRRRAILDDDDFETVLQRGREDSGVARTVLRGAPSRGQATSAKSSAITSAAVRLSQFRDS